MLKEGLRTLAHLVLDLTGGVDEEIGSDAVTDEWLAAERNEAIRVAEETPIPMVLHCPGCRLRHVDKGEFAERSHHTHACQGCGLAWRPSVRNTVGVEFLPGFKDEDLPEKGSSSMLVVVTDHHGPVGTFPRRRFHREGVDLVVHERDVLDLLRARAEAADGDEVRISLSVTGKRPFGDRKVSAFSETSYARDPGKR